MDPSPSTGFLPQRSSLDTARRVDQVCDKFELSWRRGRPLKIERLLVEVPSWERADLLLELIALEVELRAEQGHEADAKEYQQRFTEYSERIEQSFREGFAPESGALMASTPTATVAASRRTIPGGDTVTDAQGVEPNPTRIADPVDWIFGQPDHNRDRDREARAPNQQVNSTRPPTDRWVGQRLNHYHLLEQIGRGGMGAVYRAIEEKTGRFVALKLMHPEWCESLSPTRRDEALSRFRQEAMVTASIEHDNIVTLYDFHDSDGLPFYTMKYVEGQSLGEILRDGPIANDRAATLLIPIAEAVHHAHQKKLLHRDIKPSNILVDRTDRPYITDFGLAKWMSRASQLTQSGAQMGTPSYMPPETARGCPSDGPAGDVYSLGATLYAMLTGRPPFQTPHPIETLRQVVQKDPVPPRRLNTTVHPDLETICLKCLQKEPSKRYPTARELADDLRRFKNRQPILARPVGTIERLWLWSKRNRGVAALTFAVFSLLLIIGIGSTATVFKLSANAREVHARLVRQYVGQGLQLAQDSQTLAALPWFLEALRLDEGTSTEREQRIRLASALGAAPHTSYVWAFDAAIRAASFHPQPQRKWALVAGGSVAQLWDISSRERLIVESRFPDTVQRAEFSGDGDHYFVATRSELTVYDSNTRMVRTKRKFAAEIQHVAFSRDGRWIAVASGTSVFVLPLEPGSDSTRELTHKDVVRFVDFHPDQPRLAAALGSSETAVGEVVVWDLTTDRHAFAPIEHGDDVNVARHGPDGKLLVSVSFDSIVKLWDSSTGQPTSKPKKHAGLVRDASFSPDSRRVVTVSDNLAVVWSVAAEARESREFIHPGPVLDARFSPDGRRIITACEDHAARVWDVATGKLVVPPLIHNSRVTHAVISPDGQRILTASDDQVARVWEFAHLAPVVQPLATGNGENPPLAFAWNGNGDNGRFLTAEGTACVIRDLQARELARLPHPRLVQSARFENFSRGVVTHDESGEIRLWSPNGDRLVTQAQLNRPRTPHFLSATSDLRRAVLVESQGEIRVWSTGQEWREVAKHGASIVDCAFDPRGLGLVLLDERGWAWLVRLNEDHATSSRLKQQGRVSRIALSPLGGRIAIANDHGDAQLFDWASGESIEPVMTHEDRITHLEFAPNGASLATASADGSVRIWSTADGSRLAPPLRHDGGVFFATFSPDSRWLLTIAKDPRSEFQDRLRLWQAQTGDLLTLPLSPPQSMRRASISPDKRKIIYHATAGSYFWTVPTESRPLARLEHSTDLNSGARLDRYGSMTPLDAQSIRQAWVALVSADPSLLQPQSDQLLAWHDREAVECKNQGDFAVEIEHLSAAIALAPTSADLLARRANAQAQLKKWDGARRDYLAAARHGDSSLQLLYNLAVVELARQKLDAYRDACGQMIERYQNTDNPSVMNRVAWICAQGPQALENLDPAISLARKAVAHQATAYHLNTLGAILYRAGDFKEARRLLSSSVSLHEKATAVTEWAFLGMAEAKLGNLAEAQRWAAKLHDRLVGDDQILTTDSRFGSLRYWQERTLFDRQRAELEAITQSR